MEICHIIKTLLIMLFCVDFSTLEEKEIFVNVTKSWQHNSSLMVRDFIYSSCLSRNHCTMKGKPNNLPLKTFNLMSYHMLSISQNLAVGKQIYQGYPWTSDFLWCCYKRTYSIIKCICFSIFLFLFSLF